MGFFGQGWQLPFMLTEEQLLHQQQLLREKQEFDAWRASRAQAKTQSQPQALSEAEVNIQVNVDSERSAGVARARPQDQVTKQAKAKRAGSTSTSRRSPSPKRDYPRGTCTVTRPSQASPRKAEHTVAPAQDLEAFKADMTSMLSDMLQASFQRFASQFNTNSGGQGNNSKEDTIPKQVLSEPTVDVASDDDIENSPHRGPEDRSGHVTGQRSLHGRGSRKGLDWAPTNTMLFSDYHLAKLNPNCHMNYSIIFTEISFSPETSNLHQIMSTYM